MSRPALPAPAAAPGDAPGRTLTAGLFLLFAATLALRLFYVFHYRFNSDEAQELHVAWSWAQGLTPYRDVFDNHTPLFQLLSAPVAALIGETPRILFGMRLAVTACYLATLAGAYVLGRRIFGKRAGLWTAVLLGLIPTFFFKSLEYRADDLWMALWILALALLLDGRWTNGRSFGAGLLLGAALGASLKTVLLLAVLGTSALILPFLGGEGWRALTSRRVGVRLAALGAGIAVVPAVLLGYFAIEGALGPLLYGTISHNVVPGLGAWSEAHSRAIYFPPALLIVIAGVRVLLRKTPPEAEGTRLALLTLTAGIYLAAIHLLWPLFTTQDLLPFFPLLAVVATGLVMRRWDHRPVGAAGPSGRRVSAAWALSGIALLEIGLLLAFEPPWRDNTGRQTRLLDQVLRLTEPADYVLDQKGETIFRRRPIYYVMETITGSLMRRGDLPESIPEQAIATRTCVAADGIARFPERTRRFVEQNYLAVGQVRVAGRFLPIIAPAHDRPILFEVAIPARYAVVSEQGPAAGSLDGLPYTGPRFLPAGRHAFTPARGGGRLALVWARAVEKGFSPFAPLDQES